MFNKDVKLMMINLVKYKWCYDLHERYRGII